MALFSGAVQAAPSILVTGDSLSAAYGIPLQEGWVALLQKRLQAEGYPHKVLNTSVSGETTAGALVRLDKDLARYKPAIVIIELGGNDGLRGLPVNKLQDNLRSMVQRSKQADARVLLLGMRLPPNYGEAYTQAFHQAYLDVAGQNDTALVPFFLEPVVQKREYFQEDGIHPTAKAQPVLLESVWPALKPLLGDAD